MADITNKLKQFYDVIKQDSVYKDAIPNTFEEFNNPEKLKQFHAVLLKDDVYKDAIPTDFNKFIGEPIEPSPFAPDQKQEAPAENGMFNSVTGQNVEPGEPQAEQQQNVDNGPYSVSVDNTYQKDKLQPVFGALQNAVKENPQLFDPKSENADDNINTFLHQFDAQGQYTDEEKATIKDAFSFYTQQRQHDKTGDIIGSVLGSGASTLAKGAEGVAKGAGAIAYALDADPNKPPIGEFMDNPLSRGAEYLAKEAQEIIPPNKIEIAGLDVKPTAEALGMMSAFMVPSSMGANAVFSAGKFGKGLSKVLDFAAGHWGAGTLAASSGGAEAYDAARDKVNDAKTMSDADYFGKYNGGHAPDSPQTVELFNQKKILSEDDGTIPLQAFVMSLPLKYGAWGLKWANLFGPLVGTITDKTIGKVLPANITTEFSKDLVENGMVNAYQMMVDRASSNWTSKETYDNTVKITDGLKEAGISGVTIGTFFGAFNGMLKGKQYKSTADKANIKAAQEYIANAQAKIGELQPDEVFADDVEHPHISDLQNKKNFISQNIDNGVFDNSGIAKRTAMKAVGSLEDKISDIKKKVRGVISNNFLAASWTGHYDNVIGGLEQLLPYAETAAEKGEIQAQIEQAKKIQQEAKDNIKPLTISIANDEYLRDVENDMKAGNLVTVTFNSMAEVPENLKGRVVNSGGELNVQMTATENKVVNGFLKVNEPVENAAEVEIVKDIVEKKQAEGLELTPSEQKTITDNTSGDIVVDEQPVVETKPVTELVGKKVSFNGVEGIVMQDEGGKLTLENDKNIVELNQEDIASEIPEIEKVPKENKASSVEILDDGTAIVDGEQYTITTDENGSIVSLTNENRTIRSEPILVQAEIKRNSIAGTPKGTHEEVAAIVKESTQATDLEVNAIDNAIVNLITKKVATLLDNGITDETPVKSISKAISYVEKTIDFIKKNHPDSKYGKEQIKSFHELNKILHDELRNKQSNARTQEPISETGADDTQQDGLGEAKTVETGTSEPTPIEPTGDGTESPPTQSNLEKRHIDITSPSALALAYQQETIFNPSDLTEKERIINDKLGYVKGSSYSGLKNSNTKKGFGDKNNVSQGMGKAWFRSDASTIDQAALQLSRENGIQIEPQDIVDFINRFPNRRNTQSELAKEIADKYKELTGKKLDNAVVKRMLNEKLAEQSKERSLSGDKALESAANIFESNEINGETLLSHMKNNEWLYTAFGDITPEEFKLIINKLENGTEREGFAREISRANSSNEIGSEKALTEESTATTDKAENEIVEPESKKESEPQGRTREELASDLTDAKNELALAKASHEKASKTLSNDLSEKQADMFRGKEQKLFNDEADIEKVAKERKKEVDAAQEKVNNLQKQLDDTLEGQQSADFNKEKPTIESEAPKEPVTETTTEAPTETVEAPKVEPIEEKPSVILNNAIRDFTAKKEPTESDTAVKQTNEINDKYRKLFNDRITEAVTDLERNNIITKAQLKGLLDKAGKVTDYDKLAAFKEELASFGNEVNTKLSKVLNDVENKALKEGIKQGVKQTNEINKEYLKIFRERIAEVLNNNTTKADLKPSEVRTLINLAQKVTNYDNYYKFEDAYNNIFENRKHIEDFNSLQANLKKEVNRGQKTEYSRAIKLFSKINISDVKNISEYNDIAQSVLERVQLKKAGYEYNTLDLLQYTNRVQTEAKELRAKKAREAVIKDLTKHFEGTDINAGEHLSKLDIEDLLTIESRLGQSIEETIENENNKEGSATQKEKTNNRLRVIVDAIKQQIPDVADIRIEDSQTGEQRELHDYEKTVLESTLRYKTENLNNGELKLLASSLANFEANGDMKDMGYFSNKETGTTGLEANLAEGIAAGDRFRDIYNDPKITGLSSGLKNFRKLNLPLKTLVGILRGMSVGEAPAKRLLKLFNPVEKNNQIALKKSAQVNEQLDLMIDGEHKITKRESMEADMVAYLRRFEPHLFTSYEESFNTKVKNIKEGIKSTSKEVSSSEKDHLESQYMQEALDNIVGEKTAKEFYENSGLTESQQAIYSFMLEKLDNEALMSEHVARVYLGEDFHKSDDYFPTVIRSTLLDMESAAPITPSDMVSNAMKNKNINISFSKTKKETVGHDLKEGQYIKFDLIGNFKDKYKEIVYDNHTYADRQILLNVQMKGDNGKKLQKRIGNINMKVLDHKLNSMVAEQLGLYGEKADGISKVLNSVGGAIAKSDLYSQAAYVKQYVASMTLAAPFVKLGYIPQAAVLRIKNTAKVYDFVDKVAPQIIARIPLSEINYIKSTKRNIGIDESLSHTKLSKWGQMLDNGFGWSLKRGDYHVNMDIFMAKYIGELVNKGVIKDFKDFDFSDRMKDDDATVAGLVVAEIANGTSSPSQRAEQFIEKTSGQAITNAALWNYKQFGVSATQHVGSSLRTIIDGNGTKAEKSEAWRHALSYMYSAAAYATVGYETGKLIGFLFDEAAEALGYDTTKKEEKSDVKEILKRTGSSIVFSGAPTAIEEPAKFALDQIIDISKPLKDDKGKYIPNEKQYQDNNNLGRIGEAISTAHDAFMPIKEQLRTGHYDLNRTVVSSILPLLSASGKGGADVNRFIKKLQRLEEKEKREIRSGIYENYKPNKDSQQQMKQSVNRYSD